MRVGQPSVLGELIVGVLLGCCRSPRSSRLSIAGERIVDTATSTATYSAVVIMVILTTLITRPALKWRLSRRAFAPPTADGL